jgi:hypothetical protein
MRRAALVGSVDGEGTSGFADVPFDRVESEAAVGVVGNAEAFAGGDQVVDAAGSRGAEWGLNG